MSFDTELNRLNNILFLTWPGYETPFGPDSLSLNSLSTEESLGVMKRIPLDMLKEIFSHLGGSNLKSLSEPGAQQPRLVNWDFDIASLGLPESFISSQREVLLH